VNPWRRRDRPLAIGHRGHSLEAPENTFAAYRRAIELGVEMIEADVNITRDGRLAMIHDATLDRTTNGAGRVSAVTWSELQALDAGTWFDPRFAGERVPSAAATLELAREAGIAMCFEVKGADLDEAHDIAALLLDLFVEGDALGWCFMSGYDHGALGFARSRVPELLVAPDRIPDNVPANPPEACRQAAALGAIVIQNHHLFLTSELTSALHAADVAVWAWPTTDEASLVSSIEAGADGVMGDDVATMIRVLDRLRPRRDGGASHASVPPRA
jgi:glycerophosphoryl diester phosphodiesterase